MSAGVSGQVNSNATLFANVSYQSRFEGKSYAYDGKIGARFTW
ncbi:autotransporter outer membrane beta-barrel domain-containing protein [Tardiphaga sp. 804_B3_N1_9]